MVYNQIVDPDADEFGEEYRDSFESRMRQKEPKVEPASLITKYKGKIIGLYGQTVKDFANFCRLQNVPASEQLPVVPSRGDDSFGVMKPNEELVGQFLKSQNVKVEAFTPLKIASKKLE